MSPKSLVSIIGYEVLKKYLLAELMKLEVYFEIQLNISKSVVFYTGLKF